MKRLFFLDFENVGAHGLKNESYTCEDVIYLFYTENAAKISLDALSGIDASVQFVPVPAGKQSLDMHLATWLGYEISKGSDDVSYCVVSNDLDYDAIIQFWKVRNVKIRRVPISTSLKTPGSPLVNSAKSNRHNTTVCSMPLPAAPPSVPKKQSQRSALNSRILQMCSASNVCQGKAGSVASVVVRHFFGPNRKELIYRDLVKIFGQKDGARYYRIVKQAL